MPTPGRFRWYVPVCAVALLYLAGDLWLFRGPAAQVLRTFRPDSPRSIALAKGSGVVARVGFHPIDRNQLQRAIAARLWVEGRQWQDVPVPERPAVRQAALDELIDGLLLRMETSRRRLAMTPDDAEIGRAFERFAARFPNEADLDEALQKQGLARLDLRQRLAARLEQERALELCVGAPATIGESEARDWHAHHAAELAQPERLQARHVFLATLERNPEEAKATLDLAREDLAAGRKDFVTLAAELSDDEASKRLGGELGWLERRRLPADFAEAVFALPVHVPTLIRTTLGWHLVEVTAKRKAVPRGFEEARDEIVAALGTMKRREAVAALRSELRRNALIEIWLDPSAE